MVKTHLINERKIAVEFGYYCKLAKKINFIKRIISLYNDNLILYSVMISGLDFNVEKLISSLSIDSNVVNNTLSETCDGIVDKTIITTNPYDFDVFLTYLDKFSEGSYKLSIFKADVKNQKLINGSNKLLLSISVFSDATYLEMISNEKFPEGILDVLN